MFQRDSLSSFIFQGEKRKQTNTHFLYLQQRFLMLDSVKPVPHARPCSSDVCALEKIGSPASWQVTESAWAHLQLLPAQSKSQSMRYFSASKVPPAAMVTLGSLDDLSKELSLTLKPGLGKQYTPIQVYKWAVKAWELKGTISNIIKVGEHHQAQHVNQNKKEQHLLIFPPSPSLRFWRNKRTLEGKENSQWRSKHMMHGHVKSFDLLSCKSAAKKYAGCRKCVAFHCAIVAAMWCFQGENQSQWRTCIQRRIQHLYVNFLFCAISPKTVKAKSTKMSDWKHNAVTVWATGLSSCPA